MCAQVVHCAYKYNTRCAPMSTGNLNNNNLSSKKNIRFEHDLIELIEQAKDPLIPFSAWVKQACRDKLNGVVTQVITSTHNPVRPSVSMKDKSSSNHNGKGNYIYHTPAGDFTGRNPAAEANELTPHTVAKRCKDGYEGYSLEVV